MTGDISSLAPLAPTAALVKAGVTPNEILKLIQPVDGLVAAGESVKAEVVNLKPVDQAFQVLMRLTLDGGRQALVEAISQRPLPAGANLIVTQPTPSSLAITVQQSLSAAVASLTSIDTKQLPIGTLLQATVMSSQALAQNAGQPALYRKDRKSVV